MPPGATGGTAVTALARSYLAMKAWHVLAMLQWHVHLHVR